MYLLWTVILTACDHHMYHIRSSSANMHMCTHVWCGTLSDFAANFSQNLTSNTTIILDPVMHHLSMNLILSNLDIFTMTSDNSSAQVFCENNSSISFNGCRNVHVSKMKFLGCGGNRVENVNIFVLESTRFEGQDGNGTALELINSVAQITSCIFSYNRNGTLKRIVLAPETALPLPVEGVSFTAWVGGALTVTGSNVSIRHSLFENNRAEVGGAVFLRSSRAIISNSKFTENECTRGGFSLGCNSPTQPICDDNQITAGGALYQENSQTTIINSHFNNNSAAAGGAILAILGTLSIENDSQFQNNTAWRYDGGALHSWYGTINVLGSQFENNKANYLDGGAMYCFECSVFLVNSQFSTNAAISEGGGMYLADCNVIINGSHLVNNTAFTGGALHSHHSKITVLDSQMTDNRATNGAVMFVVDSTVYSYGFLLISNNSAAVISTVLHLIDSTMLLSGNVNFSNNHGSLLIFNSNITFEGCVELRNNQQHKMTSTKANFQQGGALTLFQSNAFFSERCSFEYNDAEYGGAVHSSESKIYVKGTVTIDGNRASKNGGGVYLYQSELNCQQNSNLNIRGNIAEQRGGGIHATSSSIKTIASFNQTRIIFLNNSAESGGGLSLETNANFYVLKHSVFYSKSTVRFLGNSANYGGAVFVDDNTYYATCTNLGAECFFAGISSLS